MTIQEFAKWVQLMRRKQTEYFRAKDRSYLGGLLDECRELEKKVDEAAKAILNTTPRGLFDDIRES